MKIIKTSQIVENSGNGGISKQSLKNKIYKAISPHTKGFFSDQSWESIRKIWGILDSMGLDWSMTDAKYDGNVPPQSKTWKFEINFTNNRGRPDKLYGNVIASGSGTVADPLERYDITVIIG
jgi:hypothetical protein